MTSNEFRQIVGRTPSNDPKADQLINSNLNHSPNEMNNSNNINGIENNKEGGNLFE
jgi:hypothetical protein